MNDVLNVSLDRLGFYTPYLLFVLTWIVIQKRNVFFYYYVGGFVLNYILNIMLKGFLKQPRPDSNVELLRVLENDGRHVDPQLYGMPSGHAQESFYSLLYVGCLTKDKRDKTIVWVYVVLCVIMMFQRVMTKRHTVLQIGVGMMVGGLMGCFFYWMAEKSVKGIDREKEEDNNGIQEGFVN